MASTSSRGDSVSVKILTLILVGMLVAVACASGEDDSSAADEGADVGGETTEASASDPEPGDDETDEAPDTTAAPVEETTTTTTEPEPVVMPNLIGLTETDARAQLQAAGVDSIDVQTEESLEATGSVLEQVPSAGANVSGTVTLVVAEAIAPMPNFVGQPLTGARTWAEERGITLRTETELTTESATGTVLEQIPAAGGEVGTEILLTVAERPIAQPLYELTPTDQQRASYPDDIEMNGELYTNAVLISVRERGIGDRSFGFVEYNLSRDWTSFEAVFGTSDFATSAAAAVVTIELDGEAVFTETVVFGVITPVSLDVTDVLRLKITVSAIGGGSDGFSLGLGEARLIGSAAATADEGE